MGRTIAGGLGRIRARRGRSAIVCGAAAFALGLGPGMGPVASAATLQLAGGPVLTLDPGGKSVVLDGASVNDAGDALVALSVQPDCCRLDRPLLVRQRRGPRGSFGLAVQVADTQALKGRLYCSFSTVLGSNGDAYLAYVRDGVGVQVLVRRGWNGRWTQAPVPDSAAAFG